MVATLASVIAALSVVTILIAAFIAAKTIAPLAFVSPYTWLFWAVFLFAYVPEFRLVARVRPQPGQAPDRSMGLILITGWIGFPVAFIVANWPRFILVQG